MACLTASSSRPTSFQLRLGFRGKKPNSYLHVFVKSRLSDRRILALSASSASEGKESRIVSGNSWTGSGASSDSFSGWSDKDSGNSRPKSGFGGIIGAGLAGIFLVAGVTFASLSLSKRNAGHKQQMEPLTSQQEVVLACDDLNENVNCVPNECSTVSTDEGRLQNDSEFGTGINQVSVSSIDNIEATSDRRPDDNIIVENSSVHNVVSDYHTSDTIVKASNQEDFHFRPGPDDISVSNPNSSISNLPELDLVKISSDAFTSEDSQTSSSNTPDPVAEIKENHGLVELVRLPASPSDSTHLNTDDPDGIFVSAEIENSKLSSDFTSAPNNQLTGGLLTMDDLVTSESNKYLESQVEPKDVVETLGSAASEQDSKLTETLQPSSEGLPREEQYLNENGSPRATSGSVSEYLYGNEPEANGNSESNSRSLFESSFAENSFSYAGIPAPSLVSAALQVPPGKVLVPAVVDQVQGQALSALQVLKVIEADVKPGDLCTRREYARWLVSASSVLSRNTISKVYPAMFIENVSELAFDDISPDDPDFPSIQGLAEAGLISSKLSRNDMHQSDGGQGPVLFSPESALSRQDLVSWKMALERKQLPEVDKKILYQRCGFIDIDKINPDAWPAIVADQSSGEQSIIALAFGFTRLFQPDKPVTKAQAAIALSTGESAELVSEELARIEAESMAETAVAVHTALVAQVEKDLNTSFEKELAMEREKIDAMEKLAEEARLELEKLRAERVEENSVLIKGRATIDSEMEVLSKLRQEVEQQLQSLLSSKMAIEFESDRVNKLRQEAESENQVITKLQYELDVERKALSMARAWAEEEAKRAREQAKALEEARDRWEKHGIKVIVDDDLQEDAIAGVTWLNTGKQPPIDGTVNRAENLLEKLKVLAAEIKGKSAIMIEKIIQKINFIISGLKQKAHEAATKAHELQRTYVVKAHKSVEELKQNTAGFSSSVNDGVKRLAGDCREGVEKLTQKFKT